MPRQKLILGIFTRLAVERNPATSFFKTNNGKAWLQEALNFAKGTSIASVRNLSTKPRYWFILVDSTLSKAQKKSALATFSTDTTIITKLIEVDGWADTSSAIEEDEDAVKCNLQVRLDYDDLLHRDYFDEVFKAVGTQKEPCLLSPVCGISYNIRPTRLALIHKKLPPFMCLYRLAESGQLTIFSFEHDKWPEAMMVELEKKPLWVQTITGRNIANKFGRGWMVSKVKHIRRLDLKEWNGESAVLFSTERHRLIKNILETIRENITVLRKYVVTRHKHGEPSK